MWRGMGDFARQSMITIKYSLTRMEIYLVGLGFLGLAMTGAFSRPLTLSDAWVALAWVIGAFLLMPVIFFVRGKTKERTLTVSQDGISTQIGRLKGQVPWSKVKLVNDTGKFILIVGRTGNAFFIPGRAFRGPGELAEFTAQIDRWRASSL
jgi:hypothetical protein